MTASAASSRPEPGVVERAGDSNHAAGARTELDDARTELDAVDGAPAFTLVFDAPSTTEELEQRDRLLRDVASAVAPVLGLAPRIGAVSLPPASRRWASHEPGALERAIDDTAAAGAATFLLPVSFDFGIEQKALLTSEVREAQRRHPGAEIYYDDADPAHPLLVQALVDASCCALAAADVASPKEVGVLLIADGMGDAGTRAESYRVMRLIWERLAVTRGDVAFVRHATWPLPEKLEACARSGLAWLMLPQYLGPSEHLAYARTIIADFRHRDATAAAWPLAEPLTGHPGVTAWLARRIIELHRSRRRKDERRRSAKHRAERPTMIHGPNASARLEHAGPEHSHAGAMLVDLAQPSDLRRVLELAGVTGERFFVKVTWHGYAPGTYTDAAALDALLQALPGKAVIVEGHTTSRNRGEVEIDWSNDARRRRAWIRDQEREYLARTGLLEVMQRRGATYLNVTEAYWDGECAPRAEVERLLREKAVTLHHPELAEYVPRAFVEHRGAPFISCARFKGPTRLALSNLFGLLPPPLRDAWHGPNITYFARVCCDLAKLYGTLFETWGFVESLTGAVRWDRKGLYRSRWGNYDLLPSPGVVCVGRSLPSVDVLAARLQGQDVTRSAFYDVVRAELGVPDGLVSAPLDAGSVARFT